MSRPIGFIGASGLMGHGMAKHLLAKGHGLMLHVNTRPERVADLLAAGARQAESRADMATECELVFLCVTGSPQVQESVGALLEGRRAQPEPRPPLTIVDCSTSEPAGSRQMREWCAALDAVFIDAPLTRTPVEAEAGRLNVMVGAEPEDFARLQPVLRCFAENVFHAGGPGAGHTVKLLSNFIAQAICTATAEAFAVGKKAGVDPRRLVEVVSAGGANSGLFQAMAKTLEGDLTGLRFELDNARKDIRYYTHLAEDLAVPTVVGEGVHQSLVLASALGHGRKFVPALVQAQEQLAGTQIVPR